MCKAEAAAPRDEVDSTKAIATGDNKYVQIVGLPSPVQQHQRHVMAVSHGQFGIFVLVILPLWIVLVLPCTVLCQVGRRLLIALGIIQHCRPIDNPKLIGYRDSGHTPPATVPSRKDRTYDIVLLGATGFTGRLAARHLAQTYSTTTDTKKKRKEQIKWAIAGRSPTKLKAVLRSLADELNLPSLITDIDMIIVDTLDIITLPHLVQNTRVVCSTAGPYQAYGSGVIEFCAKYGTHYTDITGEVGWVKTMMVQWNDTAKKSGAVLLPFCGHDSIPWELSVYKIRQLLLQQQPSDSDQLECVCWDECVSDAPGGTYATALLNLEGNGVNSPRGPNVLIDPFLQTPQGTPSDYTTKEHLPLLGIRPLKKGRWTAPFVMAVVNAKIIGWSHAMIQQGAQQLTYRESMVHADFKTAFCAHVGLAAMASMLLNPITKAWVYQWGLVPRPGQGPSMKTMQERNYLCVTTEGRGRRGTRVESTFYLPRDPGCLETAMLVIESGICLALDARKDDGDNNKEHPSNLPCRKQGGGGFWPPAAALGDVLLERLIHCGVEFHARVVVPQEDSFSSASKTDK
jgi:short subunit dehydrogenase-like uncharacterized protein